METEKIQLPENRPPYSNTTTCQRGFQGRKKINCRPQSPLWSEWYYSKLVENLQLYLTGVKEPRKINAKTPHKN